ncbi:type VI secretion system protein TssA [Burkholderia gladioli]|uniref:type VI secretion system protein TssA n=1 Tax=Burkholderia gladioli TaxID=28095 RepID=UPI00163F6993|nr:type VI secretion system protein TssA [Burkholderia gladioli]
MTHSDSTDPNPLLAAIDDAAPTGPDLEYDPAFTDLERIAMPTPERAMGDSLKAAQEPDWDKVAQAAEALFSRTKDLRVAVHLTAARTRRQGLAGWASGLALVRELLERYWDDVHPRLDAEDDNDPTARVNAVMPLGDPQGTLAYFRVVPFVQSPRLGRFSLRDLRVATGAIIAAPSADGAPPPTLVDLEACCLDCPEEQLPEAAALLAAAQDHANALIALLRERLGTASPDFGLLAADIAELRKFVDAQLLRRFPERAAELAAAAPADGADGEIPADMAAAAAAVAPPPGKISGHDDVIRRLDEICEYYERIEPSSPLPILLKRARRLVGKSFVEVLRDIAPGGLSELQTLSGPEAD